MSPAYSKCISGQIVTNRKYMAAVSYTHLDVYKRQALVLIILHISHFPLATVCKPLAESISNLFTDSFGRRCSTG